MGLIPEDVINQVIERSDIVEVIGQYAALKKAGRNFKALCPFHNEKTPSFVVNPDKQIFHCFGCGAGGNVIGFLTRQEHMEFPEAVRFLAERAGVEVPETSTAAEHPSRRQAEEILKVNAQASGFFHETLLTDRGPEAKAARDYLKGRGVSLETVKTFHLGYAPKEWDALLKYLKAKGIGEELMSQAGLIIAREGKAGHYDRFRNRIVFPIFDVRGRSVAFGARAMDNSDGAKYINSPETAVYTKGEHLFGLHLTKAAVGQADRIVVVEGYMDMIMPYVQGVANIAASLGTALTIAQIKLVRRYTHNVVMLYDADPAGQAAMVRSLDLLVEEGMHVRVAALSQGEDPDSFIRQQGQEAFAQRIAGAQTLLDFKFDWLARQHDAATAEGKAKIAQELLGTIGRHQSEVAKFELTRGLAHKLNVPEEILLKQAGHAAGPRTVKVQAPVPVKVSTSAIAGQELLLALFLKDAAWVKAAKSRISPEDFSDDTLRQVTEMIWALAKESEAWSAQDLLVRLQDDKTQGLVTRLISMDEGKLADPARLFTDCVGKIRQDKQKQARGRLLEDIRQAEASHDEERTNRLREEYYQLLKT